MTNPIVIVEDDDNDAVLIERALKKTVFANGIRRFCHGGEAIEYLQQVQNGAVPTPALLITDLKMPCVSGMDLLKWRGEQTIFRRVPVVVLSSSSRPDDVFEAYSLGANSYFCKPVAFPALQTLIQNIVEYWAQCAEARIEPVRQRVESELVEFRARPQAE